MKKRKLSEEIAILKRGNLQEIKQAIEAVAFQTQTQISLLGEHREFLSIYLERRKPCYLFVKTILKNREEDWVVEKSVIGNSLNPDNEYLLVQFYPELVEAYTENNPNGPYLSEEAFELAQQNPELAGKVEKLPLKEASTSLGIFFTPEMLKKFS
ncbi:MAG: hypothetical protein J6W96_02610 [Alphaproteobacteria bacterium]|nr:hypothetical protein [Alphaproteobacteria bacterium]